MEIFNGLQRLIIQIIIPRALHQPCGNHLPLGVDTDFGHSLALFMQMAGRYGVV